MLPKPTFWKSITGTDIAFVDGGEGEEDTITQVAAQFVIAGFVAGDVITVSGSKFNEGSHTIISVVAGTINVATGTLNEEGAGDSITIDTEITIFDFGDCDAGSYKPNSTGLKIYLWNDKGGAGSDIMTSVRIAVRDPDGGADKVWTKQKWIEIKSNGVGGGDGIEDDAMTAFVKVGPNYNLCLGDIPKERYRKLFVRLHTPTDAEEQNISFQIKVKHLDSATDLIEVVIIHLQDVRAADDDYVHVAIPGTGTEQEITDITNPDVPRNASIKTTNNNSPSGNVKLEGINNLGQSAEEEIATVAGSTVCGNVAWSILSKITLPATIPIGDYVSVGMSDKIGLITSIDNVDNVFKKKVNNEDKSSEIEEGKVNKIYNTLDCATIVANTEITIWYIGR